MTAPLPLIGVVVLNWNGRDCLPQCLTSLQNLRYERVFIVVVDNASTDGSLQLAERNFPQCFYLQNNENRGFAAGMNSGIKEALRRGAEWVWVFNNDAQTEENALMQLVAAGQDDPRAGLISPWIVEKKGGRLWFGKGRIDWFRMRVVHSVPTRAEKKKMAYESQFVTGCALFIRKSLFERIGFFDERFFLYYEDADLSYRSRQAGFHNLVVPGARVFHQEQSRLNRKKLYFLVYSGLRFFWKQSLWWQKPYFLLYTRVRRAYNRLRVIRGHEQAVIVRQALTDFERDFHV